MRTLVVLYKNSVNVSGRMDILDYENKATMFHKLKRHVRLATTTTATVFGNVASEIAGSSVLQPNSPQAIIKTALESPNKSRLVRFLYFGLLELCTHAVVQLARRLFYSFAQKGSEYIVVGDIERIFPTPADALAAFALFDQDNNGDVSREELEAACLYVTLLTRLWRDLLSIMKGDSTGNNFRSKTLCRTWTVLLGDWTTSSCPSTLSSLALSLLQFWFVPSFSTHSCSDGHG